MCGKLDGIFILLDGPRILGETTRIFANSNEPQFLYNFLTRYVFNSMCCSDFPRGKHRPAKFQNSATCFSCVSLPPMIRMNPVTYVPYIRGPFPSYGDTPYAFFTLNQFNSEIVCRTTFPVSLITQCNLFKFTFGFRRVPDHPVVESSKATGGPDQVHVRRSGRTKPQSISSDLDTLRYRGHGRHIIARSARGFVMKARPQCRSRRRACECYAGPL